MNSTQWIFELESLNSLETRKYDDLSSVIKLVRRSIVDLLGLNLMPIEEDLPLDDGGGSDGQGGMITRLRPPKDHEITPLSILCGNKDIVAEMLKLNSQMHDQAELDVKEDAGQLIMRSPDQLDDFFDGDIQFEDDPELQRKHLIWNSDETQIALNQMVKPMSEKDEDLKQAISPEIKPNLQKPKREKKAKVKLE